MQVLAGMVSSEGRAELSQAPSLACRWLTLHMIFSLSVLIRVQISFFFFFFFFNQDTGCIGLAHPTHELILTLLPP